jgi:hypothetical protein
VLIQEFAIVITGPLAAADVPAQPPAAGVPTTFARLANALPDLAGVAGALHQKSYTMLPDSSHGPETGESTPRLISVLGGHREAPFVRFDPRS